MRKYEEIIFLPFNNQGTIVIIESSTDHYINYWENNAPAAVCRM